MKKLFLILGVIVVLAIAAGAAGWVWRGSRLDMAGKDQSGTLIATKTPRGLSQIISSLPLAKSVPCEATAAVIGDFGLAGKPEADVSALVHGWQPDFVVTVGDNNYPNGAAATIDANIGQYYHDFIAPYTGTYGAGADVNRFFPALGNHEWHTAGANPYLDYFTLPGNERYYEEQWGPVDLFVLDSSSTEPDGVSASSKQAQWLKEHMQASMLPWQIVVLHHAPFSSSSNHGSNPILQWPYKDWGADLVLAGHDHTYERLEQDGLTYLVNGLGGGAVYGFGQALPGSKIRFQQDYGAVKLTVSDTTLQGEFYTRAHTLIDSFTLNRPAGATCGPLPN